MLELALPNMHALAVMIMILVALVLFTRESIPMETTSLVVLVALAIGFQIFPFEAEGEIIKPSDFFLGFANRALIPRRERVTRRAIRMSLSRRRPDDTMIN